MSLELGICTDKERYMFWFHCNRNNDEQIEQYLTNNMNIDRIKCVKVNVENDRDSPYWLGEFNFKYIGI